MGTLAWGERLTGTRSLAPGIAVSFALAGVAGWMAGGLGEPLAHNPVLVAMLLGLLLGNCFVCPDALRPGLDFTKRTLLRLGVVLVGFRITLGLLGDIGIVPVGIAAIELVVVFVAVRWLAVRVCRLDPELALLVAAGSAVCGAAAILCVAAMKKGRDQHAGIAIALITLAGTLALLVYPVAFGAGWLPALDDRRYGIFVGSSIFELAQVYGASFAVSEGALNTATLVKLCKVLMLVPMVLVLGSLDQRGRRTSGDGSARVPFPWFVLGFVAVMLFNSAITVHPEVRRLVLDVDQFLFMAVMVALGLTTRLSRLAVGGTGWRLIGVGVIGLVLSATVAYALVAPLAAGADASGGAPAESAMFSSAGGRLFASTGCAKCHVPSLRARDGGSVTLFSDLLLHDMGPALDDKIVQGDATGAEWRTAPLIGVGLRHRYLHDGRATELRDAVFAHGGEAQIVRDRFLGLDDTEQREVYDYLNRL